jgi:hypothetical protein
MNLQAELVAVRAAIAELSASRRESCNCISALVTVATDGSCMCATCEGGVSEDRANGAEVPEGVVPADIDPLDLLCRP